MMDLTKYQAFLESLARVGDLQFQVWDSRPRLLYTTASAQTSHAVTKADGAFVAQVMAQQTEHVVCRVDRVVRYGLPLFNDQGIVAVLMAIAETNGANAAGRTTLPSHSDVERLLAETGRLIMSEATAEEEIEDLASELEQSFEDLYLYSQIATNIKALRFSATMLQNLMRSIQSNMRADLAFAYFPERSQFNIKVQVPAMSWEPDVPVQWIDQLIAAIPQSAPSLDENYFIVNDSHEVPAYRQFAPVRYRFLAVRIWNAETFYGWLGLVSFNMREIFRRGELKLLVSMAEQVAIVIANSDLYADLEKFIINIVKSLVFAIEAKDIYTRGHSERVSRYSMLIGEELALSEKEQKDLQWASILHDIGKIGIPESILNKPSKLDDAEYAIIKKHPTKGASILKPIEQLTDSLPGIIHHHESYDGNGYPDGLKGEQIPLIARIIAIADTFDAISSSRAYRRAKSPQQALAIVEEVAGRQLDPEIVPLFRNLFDQGRISVE